MPHAVPAYLRPSNKDRLYIALYARGGKRDEDDEAKYHWALLVGPKHEDSNSKGKRFHVKETMMTVDGCTQSRWVYEEREIGMNPTAMIMVRVLVGKVANLERVAAVLRQLPVADENNPKWNCVSWVCHALKMLQVDGKTLGRSPGVTWDEAREGAMAFVTKKEHEHRFDGQAESGWFDTNRVATYDLLRGEEIIA